MHTGTKPPLYGNVMDGGSRCKPNPRDGTTDSQADACGEVMKLIIII